MEVVTPRIMKIALIGGIYGKDPRYRQSVQMTPETILEHELRRRGHQVETASHYTRLASTSFDVVHVHHLGLGALRIASDGSTVPFVYTSHDGVGMVGLDDRRRTLLAARYVMSRADGVIALSQAEAEFQRRNYPLQGALHEVISNGIDARIYEYARRNDAGKQRPWQLLYVGQLHEQKRVDLLIRALTLLPQAIELDLVYHISALEVPLRRLAAELGLAGRIHFLGPKQPEELRALYQKADIFVLPSAAEALPSVVTEALLCGTPVVATDVGGVREQLAGNGVVVFPGQASDLAAGIHRVLERYDHFAKQAASASSLASERFSVETMAARHLELYGRLVGCAGRRRRQTTLRAPIDAVVNMGVVLRCATK